MSKQDLNKPILEYLENCELVGMTFLKDYIQFLIDGAILNIYTLPQIKIGNKIITSKDNKYNDNLHKLIGKKIVIALEDKKKEMITLRFENDVELYVSLKFEDRENLEAVMLQIEADGKWNVW